MIEGAMEVVEKEELAMVVAAVEVEKEKLAMVVAAVEVVVIAWAVMVMDARGGRLRLWWRRWWWR